MTDALREKLEIMNMGEEETMENLNVQEMENIVEDLTQEELEMIQNTANMSEEELVEQEKQLKEEIKSLEEEIKDLNTELREELAKFSTDFDKTKLVESLKEMIENYKNDPKFRYEIAYMQNFIKEIESCNNFEPLLKSVKKIKNPKKILDRYETDLDNALVKLVKKFNSNAHYRFVNPIKNNIVDKAIELLGNEKDAKLFIYVFAGFASSQDRINNNSVFINEILRQLKHVQIIPETERELLKENMNKVLDLMK